MVGTLSLLEENEVHVVRLPEDGRPELEPTAHLRHPAGEIWQLQPAPHDRDLFFSVHSPVGKSAEGLRASLWRPDEAASGLEEQLSLGLPTTCVRWHGPSEVASLSEDEVVVWKLREGEASLAERMGKQQLGGDSVSVLKFDPFFKRQVSTAVKSSILTFDSRSGKEAWRVDDAHAPQVRDLDFNPLRPYTFSSGGDDCCVKFWDYRKVDAPLLNLELHSHWVWTVSYNPAYDQLLVSSSSDTFVNLWDVSSVSSSAKEGECEHTRKRTPHGVDHLIKTYDEHEDSVYSVAWSCGSDPFVFASLSYDGRLVVCRVPQAEQDRVLLSA